jgi:hypothetical protein
VRRPADISATGQAAPDDDTAAPDPAGRLDQLDRCLRRLDAHAEEEVACLAEDPRAGLGQRDVVDLGAGGLDGDAEQASAQRPDDIR